ncbi:hypothetical protein B6S12_05415 [Helicobacter valdiviensis]|uniref:PD-(D/E)XK nuclease superfamily protein n=1 Tax=Helicobacter valdiviensis TaxID=1458358 RepID=A0A2W6NGQ5_9HELI|nr:PD-(D/E)XK nuclease family protein [Helicobacter valdiviensis]PZT48160.1 hypothetical protein B6S12_05415 [Helicobacter valdiviensis]
MRDYENFFSSFLNFKNKRLENRKRMGLNDYNPLLVVQNPYLEQMHSNMLYSLLNPKGNHEQNNLFLKEFLKQCQIEGIDCKNIEIDKEYFAGDFGRFDLYLKSNECHIIIENKINAGEQEEQLERYANFLDDKNNVKYLIYLTPYGTKPSSFKKWKIFENTINKGNTKINYRQISYEKDILKWCENIKDKVKNIKNLYYAIEFYIDVIKEITNQKENQMDILEFLENANNSKNYDLILEILLQKDKIMEGFLRKICKELLIKKEFEDWEIADSNCNHLGFIFKPKITQKYYFAFCWQDVTNKDNGSFGVRIFGENIAEHTKREKIANFLKVKGINLFDSNWSFVNSGIPFNNFIKDNEISNFISNNYKKTIDINQKLKDFKSD